MPPHSSVTQMRNGKYFDLLDPNPALIDATDLAHTLAGIRRFNGKTTRHYSVAEHSILVVSALDYMQGTITRDLRLAALLHDAAEAYTGDIISPVKHLIRNVFGPIEAGIERAIEVRFNLPDEILSDPRVKQADLAALEYERRYLLPHAGGCETPPEWPQPTEEMLAWVDYAAYAPFTYAMCDSSEREIANLFLQVMKSLRAA